MKDFAQYLSARRIVATKKIPFFVHWIKDCYRFCEKPLTQCLTTGEIDRYLHHISKRKEYWQVDQTRDALLIYTFYQQRNLKTIQGTGKSKAQGEEARGEMIKILRLKHLSMSTERTYTGWVKSFLQIPEFLSTPAH